MSEQKYTCEMCGSELYLLNSNIGADLKTDNFCTVDLYKCKRCGRLSYIMKN